MELQNVTYPNLLVTTFCQHDVGLQYFWDLFAVLTTPQNNNLRGNPQKITLTMLVSPLRQHVFRLLLQIFTSKDGCDEEISGLLCCTKYE